MWWGKGGGHFFCVVFRWPVNFGSNQHYVPSLVTLIDSVVFLRERQGRLVVGQPPHPHCLYSLDATIILVATDGAFFCKLFLDLLWNVAYS